LKNDFKIGIIFSALGQYSYLFIQLIINIVLSRILSPADFGIAMIVQVFLYFFQMLVNAGMGPAIVQNKELTKKDYGVLFNHSAIFAAFCALFFGSFGFIVSQIYNNSIYIPLFWCMSVVILADGLNIVPNALLTKEKRFIAINLRQAVANLIGAAVGVVSALLGAGVYALILSVAVPAVIILILNAFIVKIQLTKSLDIKPLKAVWHFAKNQLGFTILTYFGKNSDNMLIGRFLGDAALGFYSKAYGLIVTPNVAFLGIINPVLQPILSEHQENIPLIKETYLNVAKMLGVIGFPLTAFMALNADKIIYFLFGRQWQAAVIVLAMLSLSIWAQMISAATSSIFQARNQPHLMFRISIISTICIVLATVIGILSGKLAVISICISTAYLLDFLMTNYVLMTYTLKDHIITLFKVLAKPFLLGIITALSILLIKPVTNFSSDFLTLLVRGIAWLVVIIAYLLLTGELKFIKRFLGK
jgi:PST family polysaccharide transporter